MSIHAPKEIKTTSTCSGMRSPHRDRTQTHRPQERSSRYRSHGHEDGPSMGMIALTRRSGIVQNMVDSAYRTAGDRVAVV